MKKYYIQFSTDFHLLASLASIGDLSNSKVVLVGPKTNTATLVAEKLSAELLVADPRGAKLNPSKVLSLLTRAKWCKNCVIISPFVFPSYVFVRLLEKGQLVTSIIRTDEGVGSYASIRHYYNSIKFESAQKWRLHCAAKALVKKTSVWLTGSLGICREQYMFNPDLSVDSLTIERFRRAIELLGFRGGLNGKMVYISQPGADTNFESAKLYSVFIRRLGERVGLHDIVVKRHPADSFNYSEFGFEVVEGYPLELYTLQDSVVVGFSSTALLMAKLVSHCGKVYYINAGGAGPAYHGLSSMNKRLFKFYLQSLDCDVG